MSPSLQRLAGRLRAAYGFQAHTLFVHWNRKGLGLQVFTTSGTLLEPKDEVPFETLLGLLDDTLFLLGIDWHILPPYVAAEDDPLLPWTLTPDELLGQGASTGGAPGTAAA
ncbi:hypothetical protein [Deinococcus sp. Leaf326]|jgi:hypothetical protein|uniref:hypothetical protein n=1 Tax=Deinococcus sp. Leaf326 TaxID=1736338 RepID=UPI000AAF280D|nr:hypothetical protein [Deinococcus sp. Leaf326]